LLQGTCRPLALLICGSPSHPVTMARTPGTAPSLTFVRPSSGNNPSAPAPGSPVEPGRVHRPGRFCMERTGRSPGFFCPNRSGYEEPDDDRENCCK